MTQVALALEDDDLPTDRRERRRRETMSEILRTSLEVMQEEGVGGLRLAEVARRMGLRPPSLYKHVASKSAVYDALFTVGSRAHEEAIAAATDGRPPDVDTFEAAFEASLRWCIANPTLTQLLYWRPVPGYEPSPEAFEASVRMVERTRSLLAAGVEGGLLRREAAQDEGLAVLSSLLSGIVTQQLANEPGAAVEDGRFTRHWRLLFEMYTDRYGLRQAS